MRLSNTLPCVPSSLNRAIANSIPASVRMFRPMLVPLPLAQRLTHPYLFHVTDTEGADLMLRHRCLGGRLPFITLAQDLPEAASLAEHLGVTLIFTWSGTHQVGSDFPAPSLDVAYHYVGPLNGHGTFIAKGSTAWLKLVAIALASDLSQCDPTHVLMAPIDIAVAPH